MTSRKLGLFVSRNSCFSWLCRTMLIWRILRGVFWIRMLLNRIGLLIIWGSWSLSGAWSAARIWLDIIGRMFRLLLIFSSSREKGWDLINVLRFLSLLELLTGFSTFWEPLLTVFRIKMFSLNISKLPLNVIKCLFWKILLKRNRICMTLLELKIS